MHLHWYMYSSYAVPVYKGKGDALLCGKYRGVRLLEHGMKLWEKILERRLRDIVKIDDMQFAFGKTGQLLMLYL